MYINKYIIKYLVDHGARINNEILFAACFSENKAITNYLVKHVSVTYINYEGDNDLPLYIACENGNEEITKYNGRSLSPS